jgi:hypothetical protein
LVFPGLGFSTSPLNEELEFNEEEFFDCVTDITVPPVSTPVDDDQSLADTSSGTPSPIVLTTPPASPPPAPPEIPPPATVKACPCHEIIGDVCPANIISIPCRPRAHIMSAEDSTPAHYHKAVSGPKASLWQAAINKELTAMDCLGVWDVVELSPEIRTVGTTWVFCIKNSPPDGAPEYKALLCAQGFSQTHGVN